MKKMKFLLYACVVVWALSTSASQAQEKNYPSRPITLIVAWPAGGSVDTAARLLAEPLRARLGQPILIVNRGGAVGTIGANAVAKAAPDG
jgi:tripartite-type tricarboxylate transporter receptor subunit TctC